MGVRDGKQASRLLALSITARERGDDQAADEFMKLAVEAMERDERPVVQQQQQAQAEKDERGQRVPHRGDPLTWCPLIRYAVAIAVKITAIRS